MVKVLLVGKDINYCKELMNYLNRKNNKLRIIAIFDSLDELIDFLQKSFVDIIVINTENVNIQEINDNKYMQPYLNSTILISSKNKNKLHVYGCVKNDTDFDMIKNMINEILYLKISKNYSNIDTIKGKELIGEIENELKYLGVKNSYIGVKYIIESIFILCNLDDYYNYKLENDIYPIIAKRYHKTANSVKSSINYAVSIMYVECKEDILLDYMEEYSLYKTSPKRMIFSVVKRIKKLHIIR